jgi:NAD(P)-dependent dehydrogenase (short-subunit alcohol dehydrogenase family)
MDLQGRTFLVTGGASGLGGAAVRRLVAGGGNAVIADINTEVGEQLAAELGERARFIKVDVTSEKDVQAAVELARTAFGGLHGLVNCAGVAIVGKVLDRDNNPHSLDLFARGIQVNLIGSFNCIRLAAQAMTANQPDAQGERGVIVNTASVAAFDGQIGQASYSASKAGVAGMTLPIARELARFGIRCATVAPGLFDTPMMAGLPEEARQSLGQQVPFPPRLGRPDEFAALVAHIVDNTMLNGEVIRLDGAIRMAPK